MMACMPHMTSSAVHKAVCGTNCTCNRNTCRLSSLVYAFELVDVHLNDLKAQRRLCIVFTNLSASITSAVSCKHNLCSACALPLGGTHAKQDLKT